MKKINNYLSLFNDIYKTVENNDPLDRLKKNSIIQPDSVCHD